MADTTSPIGVDHASAPPVCPSAAAAAWFGTLLVSYSALGYATANLLLRVLVGPESQTHPFWVIGVKESVTVVLVGPVLIYQLARRKIPIPTRQTLVTIGITGLLTQLVGNIGFLWAMSKIGVAIVTPLTQAACLIGSALLGYFILKERVSLRSAVAIVILIAGIVTLYWGADTGLEGVNAPPVIILAAVLIAVAAGAAYSTLVVAIRGNVTGDASPVVVIVLVTLIGSLILTPLAAWTTGLEGFRAITGPHWGLMLGAGFLNCTAFIALTFGLKWTSVVRANIITTAQIVIAAMAGWLFFGEAITAAAVVGVVLTLSGMILGSKP
ncbi:DMT family transporter [Thermostilla marina]